MRVIPPTNYILYRPYWDHNQVTLDGKNTFFQDVEVDEGEHQPVRGVVVEVPYKLDFEGDDLLDWDVEMELQVGDEVVCDFYDVFSALNEFEQRWLEVDGEKLLLIRYDRVLAARREGVIIPLNGYIFCSELEPENLSPFEKVEWRKFQHDNALGKVCYVGKRIKKYRYPPIEADDYDLPIGRIVAFDKACDIPIEHKLHRKFFDKTVFRIHRRDIIGIIITE